MSLAMLLATLVALSGLQGATPAPDASAHPIALGVVLSGSAVDQSVQWGAEQAALDVAERSTVRCSVIARRTSGNWDSLGGVVRTLIDDDHVVALLGVADGAATHLLQQIGTKTRTAVLALASEDALTRLYVKNTVRLVPDDRSQLRALRRALPEWLCGSVVAVVDDSRDGAQSATTMQRLVREGELPALTTITALAGDPAAHVVDAIVAARAENVLVWLPPRRAGELVRALRARSTAHVLGWHELLSEEFLACAGAAAEGSAVVALFDPASSDPIVSAFIAKYRAAHACLPDAMAAAAYDAASMILSLCEQAPICERESVLLALQSTRSLSLVTGHVQLDANGNRCGPILIGVCRQGAFRVEHRVTP